MKRLLLISNSVSFGKEYLDHCQDAITTFLGGTDSLLFLPFASFDVDGYASVVSKRFAKMGIQVTSLHTQQDPKKAIKEAKAIFVGGGNTFRLLKKMYDLDLLDSMRNVVLNGTFYMGASAGVNLACPTIKTTNDMPIVFPQSFNALNIFPYQINPHYINADPASKHQGETREERIKEFHQENTTPVIGLYESAWIHVEDDVIQLGGANGAKVFLPGQTPKEYGPGEKIEITNS